jgi:hypothetical protein
LADAGESAVALCNECGHERRIEIETVRIRAADVNNAKDEIRWHLRSLNLDELLEFIRRQQIHDHGPRQQIIALILAELKRRAKTEKVLNPSPSKRCQGGDRRERSGGSRRAGLVGFADDERAQQLTQLGHGGGRQLSRHCSRHGSTKGGRDDERQQ